MVDWARHGARGHLYRHARFPRGRSPLQYYHNPDIYVPPDHIRNEIVDFLFRVEAGLPAGRGWHYGMGVTLQINMDW